MAQKSGPPPLLVCFRIVGEYTVFAMTNLVCPVASLLWATRPRGSQAEFSSHSFCHGSLDAPACPEWGSDLERFGWDFKQKEGLKVESVQPECQGQNLMTNLDRSWCCRQLRTAGVVFGPSLIQPEALWQYMRLLVNWIAGVSQTDIDKQFRVNPGSDETWHMIFTATLVVH